MISRNHRRLFFLTFALSIGLVGFNNCGKIEFKGETAEKALRSGETIVGNPMTAAAKTLLGHLCAVITRCHSDIKENDCEAGILNLTTINYQLGILPGTYKSFSEIVQAESSGTLVASSSGASSCMTDVDQLSCSDSSVQNAYDPASGSFSNVQFMIPTAPGSCPAIFSQPPSRTDYYVATTGSDSNDGSQAKPWATISHASEALVPSSSGATVHVAPGNYTLPVRSDCEDSNSATCGVKTVRNGTSTAPIIYISDQQGGAKISAPGASAVWYNNGDYVQIIGFEIIGSSEANYGIFSEAAFGQIIGNHVHGIPVKNGCAKVTGGGGIVFGWLDYSHDNDAIGNLVHDIGPRLANGLPSTSYCPGQANGIVYDQPRGRIFNNIIHSIDCWGIDTWHKASSLQISHNLIFNIGNLTDTGGSVGGGIFINGETSVGVHSNSTVSNNIIRNNSKGISEFQSVGSNTYLNNLMFSNSLNFNLVSGSTPQGTITKDPLMVNFQVDGSGDYRLSASSPAIDAGTLACAAATGNGNCTPADDFSGIRRPIGPLPDIGPYEWHQ